ncbi:MAG: hypothetical protein IT179_00800 [Acidobacteria bacterium]|nr:hypothetical protein [Acidobacteriota bacterium]
MTRRSIRTFAAGVVGAWLVATGLSAAMAPGAAAAAAGSVAITVHYKGSGAVDESHRLWIWVFDTPDIGPAAMPIREESVAQNGGAVTIRGLSEARVWIAVAFDERGGSPGNQPPASGSPIGIYSVDGGQPSAVEPADDTRVSVTFDDSMRMP